jgi:hypothetical protein
MPRVRFFALLSVWLFPLLLWGQGGMGGMGGFNRNNSGGFGGQNSGGQFGGNPFAQPDSVDVDSTQLPEIEPETRWVRPADLFAHREFRPLASPQLARIHYWDQLDRVSGFVQSLGQTGKPYQVLFQGIEERHYDRDLWYDPFLGRYDRYAAGPRTGVDFYDTRTPYVRVDYAQTQARTVITDATITQNINPRLNIALYIKRQLSEGIYRNFVTDHTQIWGSSNYHSQDRRYWLFVGVAFNAQNDQLNGGVPRNPETGFVRQDGVYLDQLAAYNQSFFGGLSSPVLRDAPLRRGLLGGSVDQYYHLIGHGDSTDAHRLTLRGLLQVERNQRSFSDLNLDSSLRTDFLIPIYPSLDLASADSLGNIDLFEGYVVGHGTAQAEVSYTWTPRPGMRLHAEGGLRYQLIEASKEDSGIVSQSLTDQFAQAELRFPWLAINGQLRQRISSRLAPERAIEAGVKLYPLARLGQADDTASSPLRINGQVSLKNLNPSLFQTYFWGDSGNAFRPRPDLVNQTLFHAQAGLELIGQRTIKRGDTLLPMYLQVGGFLQRIDRQIYYDSVFQVRQAPTGVPMQWLGASVQGRLRLWRHFFLETDTRLQIGQVSEGDPSRNWLSRSIPLVHGRTSFYADYRNVSWAEQARFGLDVMYRSDYLAQAVDPWSGEFFPTNYLNLPYAQIDVYAALRLRGVYIFFKFQHVNEGLLVGGYYTTPFYPMWGRSFALGLNWQFFN